MKKQCSKCKRMLDHSEFHKNKQSKDGLNYRCKRCKSKYDRERRISLKREAINAFGGRCINIDANGVQCSKNSIDDLEDLHLIHPNGDGDVHRNLISNGKGSLPFYRALKKRGWNTGKFVVQVMCASHHHIFDKSGKKNPNYGRRGKLDPNYKKGKFNDPVWLREKYKIMTAQEIADLCGVSIGTIRNRIKKFAISR